MVSSRQGKRLLAAVAGAGLALATITVVLAVAVGDPVRAIFRQRLIGDALLILLATSGFHPLRTSNSLASRGRLIANGRRALQQFQVALVRCELVGERALSAFPQV
jgi:hypothetical protein